MLGTSPIYNQNSWLRGLYPSREAAIPNVTTGFGFMATDGLSSFLLRSENIYTDIANEEMKDRYCHVRTYCNM
jgi:hypothetical protein